MNHKSFIVVVLLLVFLAVGCGGGGIEVESLDQLGEMVSEQGIDCSGLEDDNTELIAREGGSCEDGEVDLYVFNNAENRDNYLEIAEAFGGGPYVLGENWVINMPSLGAAEDLADSLEASVR